jgi:hypothetical protein
VPLRGLARDAFLLCRCHGLPLTRADKPLLSILERSSFSDEQIGAFRKFSYGIAPAIAFHRGLRFATRHD